MGCKICNIYRISFTELITNDELKSFNPMMLQAEIQKIVKANPEKHSRMSKQVWLYPDRSKDKVFAEVQKRWATDTHVSSAVFCVFLLNPTFYMFPNISVDHIFHMMSFSKFSVLQK